MPFRIRILKQNGLTDLYPRAFRLKSCLSDMYNGNVGSLTLMREDDAAPDNQKCSSQKRKGEKCRRVLPHVVIVPLETAPAPTVQAANVGGMNVLLALADLPSRYNKYIRILLGSARLLTLPRGLTPHRASTAMAA